MRILSRKFVALAVACSGVALAPSVRAQNNVGYQLNRYEDSPVGDPFLSVEHPWYSSTRYFAGGITVDYAHNLLIAGHYDSAGNFVRDSSVVEHQVQGHVDLAASFLDRIAILASFPLVLWEQGTPAAGVTDVTANSGVAYGDLRLGLRLRFFGQPEGGPASMSIAGNVWVPLPNTASHHTGDPSVRALGRLIFGGVAAKHFRYTLNAGFYWRPTAQISAQASQVANTVGMEVQGGVGLQVTFLDQSLSIGPEALVSFALANALPSQQSLANLELLGTFSVLIANQVILQLSGGAGLIGSPGPPDARGIIRFAYAPRRQQEAKKAAPPSDRDLDGIPDESDACPDEKGVESIDPKKNGCPPPRDRDRDGVLDADDQCPDEPQGTHPDPGRRGCPAKDSDGDGFFDFEDNCPKVPAGDHPDPTKKGCPAIDSDDDGVYDYEDVCPNEKPGMNPDSKRKGCPAPDRDHDGVPDEVDACPDTPGGPSPDPKKNGCPGLVQIKNNQIVILQQVFFDTAKDTIQKRSFPVLDAVAYVMKSQAAIKRISVEGHTDNKGKPAKNMDLSQRRAASVMRYLTSQGVETDRLEAHGYGDTRPIADNKTSSGRGQNRRVAFTIVDPAPTAN